MFPALKTMISASRPIPLTATERFTQWSSLSYCLIGIGMILSPSLWGKLWGADLVGRTVGYIQLAGSALAIEGFLLVIAARSIHKVPGHGHVTITAVTRLVLVNLALWKMYVGGLAPIRYMAFFAVLDNALAAGMILVWFSTESGASVGLFFREIMGLVFRVPHGSRSSLAALLIGLVQFPGSLYMRNADRLQSFFNLHPFVGYSFTFLSFSFSMNAAHAVLYVFNGQAVSKAFNMSCVFYRVVFQMPVLLFLGYTDKVESGLTAFLLCIELGFALFMASFLYFDKKQSCKK